MINDPENAEDRMSKSVAALVEAFKKVRTGRANPAILDSVMIVITVHPHRSIRLQTLLLKTVVVVRSTLGKRPWYHRLRKPF